jgi:hypothetical protein
MVPSASRADALAATSRDEEIARRAFFTGFPVPRWCASVLASDDYPRVSFESYPIITELEFLDAERTKAAARIVVGHEPPRTDDSA